MQTYEYRGYDATGKACRGLVEALSPKQAREKLVSGGILAERLAVSGGADRGRVSVDARAMVYRGLASLLRAGLPLVRALGVLIDSPELTPVRPLLARVRDRVREGVSLAAALAEGSRSVTPFESAIVEAAESSGSVEMMLEQLAVFLEAQQKLREKVQGALVYPSIVFTVGICVAIVMLGLLVPRTRDILGGNEASLPALTAFMMALGRFCTTWGLALLGGLALGGLYARLRLERDAAFRRDWSRLLFRLPVFGRGCRLLVNLRFAQTLAILLRGGLSGIRAFPLAGRATGNPWIASLTEERAESIRHGGSLSDAVRSVPPLAESLPGWLEIGEASGGLEPLLVSAGQRYQERWDRYVSRCLALLEPLLILTIGGFVLLVTLSVLLPVINLSSRIG